MNVTAAVGEQDDALRPWTEAEETYLANAAGILSPENLGRALGRTEASVEEAAGRLGLDVRCDGSSFVWCDHCATWRTRLNSRTGWCRICTMREQLRGRERACAEALAAMAPSCRPTPSSGSSPPHRTASRASRRRATSRKWRNGSTACSSCATTPPKPALGACVRRRVRTPGRQAGETGDTSGIL